MTSGIRIGTPSVTTRGFKEDDVAELASLVAYVLRRPADASALSQTKDAVRDLAERFPVP